MHEQRSNEWFQARKNRVTGSEVGAILGYSPFLKVEDVMRRKVREYHGAPNEFEGNQATQWGTTNESGAIVEYEMETGNKVISTGFYEYEDWLGASPDGLVDADGLIEVKCPFGLRNEEAPVPFKTAKDQMHYWAQMQVQMHVTRRSWCDFYQWTPNETKLEKVLYDADFIASVLPKLKLFWENYLIVRSDPNSAHLEPKRVVIETPRAAQLMAEYDDTCATIEKAENRKKELIEKMVEMADGANAKIAGRNLTLIKKDGAISYAKAIKTLLPNANLDPWRGKPTQYWVVK
jgi:putative phage-type endonuclease